MANKHKFSGKKLWSDKTQNNFTTSTNLCQTCYTVCCLSNPNSKLVDSPTSDPLLYQIVAYNPKAIPSVSLLITSCQWVL